jgi:hypothetical protein
MNISQILLLCTQIHNSHATASSGSYQVLQNIPQPWYLERLRISWRGTSRQNEGKLDPLHVVLVVGWAAPFPQLGAKIDGDLAQSGEELLHPAQGESAAVAGIPGQFKVNNTDR